MPGEKRAPDWVQVTDQAGWQPRDSQGEVVYRDQLWILGGWFNSFEAPPRDVWSSHDGKAWRLVQASALAAQRPADDARFRPQDLVDGRLV